MRTAPGANGSFRAFAVHDDADDFYVVGRLQNFEHALGIRHLRNGAGETKLTASMCVKPASIRLRR